MAEQSENDLYPKDDESIIEKSTKSLKKSQKIHQHALDEMEKMGGKRGGANNIFSLTKFPQF